MKTRFVSICVFFLILAMTLTACNGGGGSDGTTSLNGKKVIFVGYSYTYYGYVVHRGAMDVDLSKSVFRQKDRELTRCYGDAEYTAVFQAN